MCALRRTQSHSWECCSSLGCGSARGNRQCSESPGAGHSLLSTGHPFPQHPRERMERESACSSHLVGELCHQQWKVHLVHPHLMQASRALGSSLSPQVCQEHGTEGPIVTINLHEGEPTHRHHHTPQAGAVSDSSQTLFHTQFLQPFPHTKVAQIKMDKSQSLNQPRVWVSLDTETNLSFAVLAHLCCSPLTPHLCMLLCFQFQIRSTVYRNRFHLLHGHQDFLQGIRHGLSPSPWCLQH